MTLDLTQMAVRMASDPLQNKASLDALRLEVAAREAMPVARATGITATAPNPFNPKTTISYYVPWTGTDTRGSRVASGVYFFRMRAGDVVDTKRVIMVK